MALKRTLKRRVSAGSFHGSPRGKRFASFKEWTNGGRLFIIDVNCGRLIGATPHLRGGAYRRRSNVEGLKGESLLRA